MTYRKIIADYLKSQNDWVYGYLLERNHTPFGWLGPRGSRTARELAQEGIIERRIAPKEVFVQYRWPVEEKSIEKPEIKIKVSRYEVFTDAITGKEIARVPV